MAAKGLPTDMAYLTPTSLAEALPMLSSGPATIVAGGTDVFPASTERQLAGQVIDISALGELRGISVQDNNVRIGALTRWRDLRVAALPPAFDGLRAAAVEVGGRQIQNSGTVAGNICNASPAADGVPPLLTLDAQVELSSVAGIRVLDLSDFILAPRRTARAPGEMVTAIVIPAPSPSAVSAFEKLGTRRYLVISIAMAAALIRLDEDGCIAEARVAVGACSPVAMRLRRLELDLVGRSPAKPGIESFHFDGLVPIDDARGTASYRRQCVIELCRRAIARAGGVLG